MIFCTACGTEADDQSSFCDQCGTALVAALPRQCPECGRRNRGTANFCSACGTGLTAAAAPAVPTAPPTVEAAPPATPAPHAPAAPVAPEIPPVPTTPQPADSPPLEVPATRAPARGTTPNVAPASRAPAAEVAAVAPVTVQGGPAPSLTDSRQPSSAPPERDRSGTREPPPPPGPSLADGAREWAASRQADILLYLGAFLLVAAALLFVSSQGTELSSGLRVALLLVYTIGFTVAGLVAQRTDRIREAGMVFLAIGALITPLNFLLVYTEILESRDVSREVVWLIGSLYSGAFYAVLWRRGYGALYVIPTALAVVSAWAALFAVLEIPGEWFGPWWVVFLVAATVAADRAGRYAAPAAWILGALLTLVVLVQVLASDLMFGDDGRVALPVSLGLATAWVALTGWSLRAPLLLPWGATVAIATGIAATRAAGLDEDWAAYSPLAVGLVAVFARRWWAHWDLGMARLGWAYAAVCALAPLALIAVFDDGPHGAISFLLAAVLLGSIAWRDQTDGVRLFDDVPRGTPTELAERTVFGWLGWALLLIGVAYTQRDLGVGAPNTGWAYVALSLASVGLLARTGARWRPAPAVLIPPAIVAMLVSLPNEASYPGHVALNLALPSAALLGAFAVTRRWSISLVVAVTAVFAALAAWSALDWPRWTLAIAYSLVGAGLFALLTALRSYRPDSRATIAAILSWSYVALGPFVAFIELTAYPPPNPVNESAEYRTLFYLLLLGAPLLLYEGWRFRNWNVSAAATTLAAIVVAPLWTSYGWPGWSLSLAYLAVGILRFATMSAVRTYRGERSQLAIVPLSWGLIAAAPFTAWVALTDRMTSDGGIAVEMVEFRAFIAGILAVALLLLYEARRLQARWALVSASAVGMAALLLTIATFRFDNVQAYTVPVGLYWIAFGLIVRRSSQVIERHLMLHEAVLLGGVAILLAPQVREGLQPDGAAWGGVVLLEGALFLLVGFLLASRWLTVSGVLAISGVAIRWLGDSSGDTIPYWLSLGGTGMLLLLLGTVLLLARDWWIAAKDATIAWWRRSATLRGVGIEWPVVFAPAAVALIAIVIAAIEDWVEPLSL